MIKAQIVADSKNGFGNRLTTFVVTFPRIILAELNTHRMFSRNSASSRAIPFEKMVESVQKSPFIPIAWQKDHKGMQGTEYFGDETITYTPEKWLGEAYTGSTAKLLTWLWLKAATLAVGAAKALNYIGVTKQLCNRLLEPFMWHTAIITATEFENFFALRCPQYLLYDRTPRLVRFRSRKDAIKQMPDLQAEGIRTKTMSDMDWLLLNKGQAEIHIMALAEAMWDAYNESIPKELKAGEWHIPFGDQTDLVQVAQTLMKRNEAPGWDDTYETECEFDSDPNSFYQTYLTPALVKIATARCARVSYTVLGEESKAPNYENDIKLHDRLFESGHMSPFEHIGQAMFRDEYDTYHNGRLRDYSSTGEGYHPDEENLGWNGNFRGFIQYRKMLPNENRTVKS